MPITRRHFLTAGAVVGLSALPAAGIEPIRRTGKPAFRLSLAAYSFRRDLNLKGQPKPAMTLEGFIDLAAGLPLDAVELTGYYFPDTTPAYVARLKGRATRLGLDVSGSAVGNNFCVPDAARWKQEVASVKQWTEITSRLGGKTLRIFAGNITKGDTEERARARCLDAIGECCEHAAQFGVYLALENHGGITATPEQLLALVQAVKSEWFGVNWDSGNFHTADPYADLARIAPYAVVAQIKTEIQRAGKEKEAADLRRMVEILRNAGYRGYIALEYEAAEDPHKAVPRFAEALRKLVGG